MVPRRITRRMASLSVAAVLGVIGAAMWRVGAVRRRASRQVAWGRLWPRPDGSVRSFGEVWDHPDPSAAA